MSTPTFQGAISHYLIESLLDDNEMILYHILRTIQFLAQYKVFNQTDIVDIVKKIVLCPQLFDPSRIAFCSILDNISSRLLWTPSSLSTSVFLLPRFKSYWYSVRYLGHPFRRIT